VAGDVQGTEANLYAGLYSSGSWNLGATVNTTAKTLTFTGATSFSDISGGEQFALPVTWYSFEGVTENIGNRLLWATSMEYNAQNFEVQYSTNGFDFQTIGIVPATGFSNEIRTYEFHHSNPDQTSFYRLKQNDFDGGFEYSKIVKITVEAFKTPIIVKSFDDRFEISVPVAIQQYAYSLVDIQGRTLESGSFTTQVQFDKIALPKGQYILYLKTENEFEVVKLINY
jgi:hypothetical protein